ncbi:MAG TPA: copper chaperone CopZ [Clostridia bacterium]|nr:copper chaperone CopZ [Clostridia bacterium]
MEKTVLQVQGMSCQHCVKAVHNAVSALPGVESVEVNLAGKTATVTYDPDQCPLERIKLEIEDQGYDVVG